MAGCDGNLRAAERDAHHRRRDVDPIECQKNGTSTRRGHLPAILDQVPTRGRDALPGRARHQKGRHEERCADRAEPRLAPTQADWYSNLGIVLKARTKVDDAVTAFRRRLRSIRAT